MSKKNPVRIKWPPEDEPFNLDEDYLNCIQSLMDAVNEHYRDGVYDPEKHLLLQCPPYRAQIEELHEYYRTRLSAEDAADRANLVDDLFNNAIRKRCLKDRLLTLASGVEINYGMLYDKDHTVKETAFFKQ